MPNLTLEDLNALRRRKGKEGVEKLSVVAPRFRKLLHRATKGDLIELQSLEHSIEDAELLLAVAVSRDVRVTHPSGVYINNGEKAFKSRYGRYPTPLELQCFCHIERIRYTEPHINPIEDPYGLRDEAASSQEAPEVEETTDDPFQSVGAGGSGGNGPTDGPDDERRGPSVAQTSEEPDSNPGPETVEAEAEVVDPGVGPASTPFQMILKRDGLDIRVQGTVQNPLFNANDTCALLAHSDPSKLCKDLISDAIAGGGRKEDVVQKHLDSSTPTQSRSGENTAKRPPLQPVLWLTEEGFYGAVLRSRKKEAACIRWWLQSDVLPKLRKTGRFEVPNPTQPMMLARESEDRMVQRMDDRVTGSTQAITLRIDSLATSLGSRPSFVVSAPEGTDLRTLEELTVELLSRQEAAVERQEAAAQRCEAAADRTEAIATRQEVHEGRLSRMVDRLVHFATKFTTDRKIVCAVARDLIASGLSV